MKKITLKKEGGRVKVLKVEGDNAKKTWGKIEGEFIYDFELRDVKADMEKDNFKVIVI